MLSLILGRHKRRCAEFVGLEKVVSLLDAGARQEPKRLAGAPFLFEDPGGASRKTSDAHQSPMCWVNCVRLLCYTYALVSATN